MPEGGKEKAAAPSAKGAADGSRGAIDLPEADGAVNGSRKALALAQAAVTKAAWTLSAKDGAAVAVPGTTEIGGVIVETRADAPDADELEAGGAGVSPAGELALRLALPGGAFDAALWSAAEGPLAEEKADGAFDFALPADGVWHWLRIRDADVDAFSVWLRAE